MEHTNCSGHPEERNDQAWMRELSVDTPHGRDGAGVAQRSSVKRRAPQGQDNDNVFMSAAVAELTFFFPRSVAELTVCQAMERRSRGMPIQRLARHDFA